MSIATFCVDFAIDAWDKKQQQEFLKQATYISDALISELEPYDETEMDEDSAPLQLIGIKFKATIGVWRESMSEAFIRNKIKNDILDFFPDAKEVWGECYPIDPEPPWFNIEIVNPKELAIRKEQRKRQKNK